MQAGTLAHFARLVLVLGLSACGGSSSGDGDNNTQNSALRDGHARFQVLSPTLIRLEYSEDDQFEDGPTQTVAERPVPAVPISTAAVNGERVIRTSALTLRYRQGSGPFTPQNLSVELNAGGDAVTANPDWVSSPDNLGGWLRGLDNEQNPVPLHDGLLSRQGWYLLDDSQTVLLTDTPPGFKVRQGRAGTYQDGYFFGYGHDYAQGLADLRLLTGAAPLLPRKAFGVWFSRYWAYSETELRDLVAQFRAHNVPLDTLSIDTDWKRVHNPIGCIFFSAVAGARPGDPCSWNGWDWNRDLFPDPPAFLAWLRQQGIQVALNIHPSISSADPEFAETQATSGGLETDSSTPPCFLFQADISECHVFDWTNAKHLEAYFALHDPIAAGIDFWWLDWCCDGSHAVAPGLTADTWINAQYAGDLEARGSRWPVFSRIGASFQEGKDGIANKGAGAFAEHRYTLHFTGDTCGTWQMLAFEGEMTAAEGNIGMPYVTHDIGSFLGPPLAGGICNGVLGHTSHLPDDLYVRWVQFGTFQPLDRLHSAHGDRLPWEYPGAPEQIASEFLRLRERLVPHLYTLSREAHDTGLPMVRSLYLQWPELDAAYEHRSENTLGNDLLVAMVASPGDTANVDVWIPPGTWYDYFTGESFTGPAVVTRSVPLNRYPVFLRAGAILPTQPDLPTSSFGPQDNLVLSVWPGGGSEYGLYEDEGQGFGYRDGAFSRTRITSGSSGAGCRSLTIGVASGSFPGKPAARSWTVRLIGMPAPGVVRVGGQPLPAGSWSYDAATQSLILSTGPQATDVSLSIVAGPAACATG